MPIFFLKSVRCPSPLFDILDYVHFCDSSDTRSSTANKLQHPVTSSTSSSNFTLIDFHAYGMELLAYHWQQCLHLSCYILPENPFILASFPWQVYWTQTIPVRTTISVRVHLVSIQAQTLLIFSIVGFHIYCGCPSVPIALLYLYLSHFMFSFTQAVTVHCKAKINK